MYIVQYMAYNYEINIVGVLLQIQQNFNLYRRWKNRACKRSTFLI